jgi:serine/threonine protein kinase
MKCPRCQKEIPTEASSCSACGFSFDDATQKLESPETPFRKSKQKSFSSLDSIDDARFVPGTILAARYRIVGLLGRGGMGEVYRADDLKLGQPVALKFLPEHLLSDGPALARFHREVRVARQVSHKNVCRVYDIGEIDGRHFLSMEFIKGEELSSLLRRIGRLPQDKALQLARQICAGLAAAHDVGFLHRDLKPANIMIDGDGNARVLDFGLGGLTEEFEEEEIRAGTPAYMSPEQIDGKDQTVQSDIYSLGLVLYELFTGKRAFEAPSLNELIKLRRSDTSPTTPSAIVKDLDPLIEKIIDRCIQKDPTQRPSSALQVAAALPGGDPIAAALAAGETPSPEMVVAAPKRGTLRPAVAIGLLALFVAFLAGAALLSKQVALHRIIPFRKSPELLQEQARQIKTSFSYTATPADATWGFQADLDYYMYLNANHASLKPWEALKSSQPPVIHFWYRQSPQALVPSSEQFVRFSDPPADLPGMIRLSLDTDGKLFYFEATPEQILSGAAGSQADAKPLDWSMVFQSAGLNLADFQPTESQWTPPRAFDNRHAWTGVYPGLPQVPIRIEAASFQNRPVYFEIISPWTRPASAAGVPASIGQKISTWTLFGLFFGTMLAGALLALRNLRVGRGDRRGAFRVALFIFLVRMGIWVFGTHHVGEMRELLLLVTGIQSALFWSCFVGVMYLALEPYLRRRWPDRIISWNRLLVGDLRDPLVGRDLLVGLALGAFCGFLIFLRLAVPQWLGVYPGMPEMMDGFEMGVTGVSAFGQTIINQVTASVVQTFMVTFLLLFLSILLRKDWLGITVGTVIMIAIFNAPLVGRDHWIGSLVISLVVVTLVWCAIRFGPLALIANVVVFHLWVFYPITTDVTAWYAGNFVLCTVILLCLAIYCFFVSLGGQKLMSRNLLDD